MQAGRRGHRAAAAAGAAASLGRLCAACVTFFFFFLEPVSLTTTLSPSRKGAPGENPPPPLLPGQFCRAGRGFKNRRHGFKNGNFGLDYFTPFVNLKLYYVTFLL